MKRLAYNEARLKAFSDHLNRFQSLVITTHVQPDGDGIGSCVALYYHLKQKGKKVHVILPSSAPEKFHIADPENLIQVFDESHFPKTDAIVVVDTNELKMLGPLAQLITESKTPVLFIDHHVKALKDTKGHLIDESASSSGELVYRFLDFENCQFNSKIATALYIAILTDTGHFRFHRTTSNTHQVVSELLKFGINPEEIFQNVFGRDSLDKLRLLGMSLSRLQSDKAGQLVWMVIDKTMRLTSGATVEDTESFIGHLTILKNVKIAALFREEDNGTTKLSLRGLRGQSVVDLAKKFGGGGHRFAAGAKIDRPLQEAINLVLQEASSIL